MNTGSGTRETGASKPPTASSLLPRHLSAETRPEQVTALRPRAGLGRRYYLPSPLRSGTAYLRSGHRCLLQKKSWVTMSGKTCRPENVVKAFRQAHRGGEKRQVAGTSSDRGLQYCSVLYQSVHDETNNLFNDRWLRRCYQNALAERINGILKNEFYSRVLQAAPSAEIVKESVAI